MRYFYPLAPALAFILFLSYELQKSKQEIQHLNDTVKGVIKMHNKKNHELNALQYECDTLRNANEQLIRYAIPSSVNKAIQHTPLPKMKG